MLSSLGITDGDILDIEDDFEDTFSTSSDDKADTGDKYASMLSLTPELSTMTACGNIGGEVDVNCIIENVEVIPYWRLINGILRVEGYSREDSTKWIYNGICRKYLIRKNPGKGPFKNAATFYVRVYDDEKDEYKEPSIKIFHNGGFQITGVRTPVQMNEAIRIIVDAIKKIEGGFKEDGAPFKDRAFSEVCMMNADVCIKHTLYRSSIQKILSTSSGIRSTFESTAYQGVNIKFYWNAQKALRGEEQDGICPCDIQCASSGKKTSVKQTALNVKTKCTKVTIAPFQTGKIIITGAKHEQQIRDAAKWILGFIVANGSEVIGPLVKKPTKKNLPDPMRKSYPFVVKISEDLFEEDVSSVEGSVSSV